MRIVLILLVLGLGGFAAWWFLMRDGDITEIFSRPYPKDSSELTASVEIHEPKDGPVLISAQSKSDLFYAQGLYHGRRGGEKLVKLLELFRGKKGAGTDAAMSRMAEFFYFLGLQPVAEKSWELYPLNIKQHLTSYAAGLRDAEKMEHPWTPQDVLLFHRGFAFLAGGGFAKEWTGNQLVSRVGVAAMEPFTGFTPAELGGLTRNAEAAPNMAVFFDPFVETVRLRTDAGDPEVLYRARPSCAWLFAPMTLDLKQQWTVKGVSIMGIPALWSGTNGTLAYHPQIVPADDAQFFEIPKTAYLGQSNQVEIHNEAPYREDYISPPMHSARGCFLGPLVRGAENMDTWYYWDGLRPSADLVPVFRLLEAKDIDTAVTAYQYHQVPALELLLRDVDGREANVALRPSDPTIPFAEKGANLFQGPKIGYRPVYAERGAAYTSERSNRNHSVLDDELREMLRFFLRDERYKGIIGEDGFAFMSEILKSDRSTQVDFLIQKTWAAFEAELFAEKSITRPLPDLTLKRYLLAGFGRGRYEGVAGLPQSARGRIIAEMLAEIYTAWPESIQYKMVDGKGAHDVTPKTVSQSEDSMRGNFYINFQGEVHLINSLRVTLNQDFPAFAYDRSDGALPKDPKPLNPSARMTSPHKVSPQ